MADPMRRPTNYYQSENGNKRPPTAEKLEEEMELVNFEVSAYETIC
jgi:hypothetical protein